MPKKSGGVDGKFKVDVAWNMVSLFFLAVAGMGLNLVIGRYYGAQYLGLFNIAFALYIFLSQFAVFGLNMSILRYVSEHMGGRQDDIDNTIIHGLAVVTVTSCLVTLAAWLATPLVTAIYKSPHMSTAYWLLLPGLIAFSINKYLLAVINGARHMRAFAIFQSLRFIFIFVALIGIIVTSRNGEYLTSVITIAEFCLMPLLLLYTFYTGNIVKQSRFSLRSPWIAKHFHFGRRVFLSGTVHSLNTSVDILMIGAFLGEVQAGIYSVAILLIGGMIQAVVVIRNNINPLLTRYVLEKKYEEFTIFSRKVSLYFTLFMIVAGSVMVIFYPYVAQIIFKEGEFDAAYLPLMILTAGIVLASPYLPFNMMLSQADKPALHSTYMAAVLTSNALFNAVGIPLLGITGAAIATAMSYVFSASLLMYLTRRYLGVKIWL